MLQVSADALKAMSEDEAVAHLSGDVEVRGSMAVTNEAIGADQVWAGLDGMKKFTGAGIVLGSGASVAWLVGGVLCGSLARWATLASGVSVVRSRLTPAVMRGVNVVAGGVLAVWAVRTMAVALAR